MREYNKINHLLKDHKGKIVDAFNMKPWVAIKGKLWWSNELGKWTVSTQEFCKSFVVETYASITFELLDIEKVETEGGLAIYINE